MRQTTLASFMVTKKKHQLKRTFSLLIGCLNCLLISFFKHKNVVAVKKAFFQNNIRFSQLDDISRKAWRNNAEHVQKKVINSS